MLLVKIEYCKANRRWLILEISWRNSKAKTNNIYSDSQDSDLLKAMTKNIFSAQFKNSFESQLKKNFSSIISTQKLN